MTMKKITDLIPNIKNCLSNKNYRYILLGVILLIIVLICVRLFYYNDKEGFENQIKALVNYEHRNFDKDNKSIWDNRMFLLQPEKANDQKFSFWNLDKDIYRESTPEKEPQKSLGTTINTVSNTQIPEKGSIAITGGKYKVYNDYEHIVTLGDDELGDLRLNYEKFQKSNSSEIKEILNKVKVNKEVCVKLNKYFESLNNININEFTKPLENFTDTILKNMVTTCLVAGDKSDNGSSKSVSLYHIINDTNGVYQAPSNKVDVFHGVPFGVSLTIYSEPNFGGVNKNLFVPFDTNKVYSDILTSKIDDTSIIDTSKLINDYEVQLKYNTLNYEGNTKAYEFSMARNVPQSINYDSTTSADRNLTNYVSIVNIQPGGLLSTSKKDLATAYKRFSDNNFDTGLSNVSFFKPSTSSDDGMSSYGYKVGMKLGLIPVVIRRKANSILVGDKSKTDTITERYDDLGKIYMAKLDESSINSVPAFQRPYEYFNNIINDILPVYINGNDKTLKNNSVRGYLQKIVTNLSHIPENVKIFSTPKPEIPADIPLVNIKVNYFKTKDMIQLLKTDDEYVQNNNISVFNHNIMDINQFLDNVYQSEQSDSEIFTKEILEKKIKDRSSFYNFPQLLSYYNDESSGCKKSGSKEFDFNQNGYRELYGNTPSNSLEIGKKYRYGSFSNLDAERFNCFKTDNLDVFLFSYEFHPSLADQSIFGEVKSFQINAENYKDNLLKELRNKLDNKVKDIIHDSKLKKEINDKISYNNRNLKILDQLEKFLEKVNSNQLKFPYIKFVKPVAPKGYISLGDIAIPSEQTLKTQEKGVDEDGKPVNYTSRFKYLFGGNKHGYNYIHKHIAHYVAVPESCTKFVRSWQMTDKIFEINQDNKLVSIFQNPFTNTIFVTQNNKLPRDGIRKLIACVKKCNAVDNLIRADQCARDLYRTKKGMEYGYNVSPNYADEEENKYYLNKVKERSSHINKLSNIARKLQIDQDKFDILNQEHNRGKLQKYLDTQNKNINILTDKLQSDRNKIDLNVYIKPTPIKLDEDDEDEEVTQKDTAKQVIKFIEQSELPKLNKKKLVDKVVKYQAMTESKLMTQNEFKLNMEKILDDCPEYDLSGLVKKDLVRDVCYGCDI